ncbi:AraC family ligand binding domain-containing protein [Chryseobacterium wanjuense]
MPKNDSITLNKMDYSSGIAVGIWDGSTPGMIKALAPHRHDHYTCMLIETGTLEVLFDCRHLAMSPGTFLFLLPDRFIRFSALWVQPAIIFPLRVIISPHPHRQV